MHLEFVSREDYAKKNMPAFERKWTEKYRNALAVPEGGAGPSGIKGCEEILLFVDKAKYTDILCAFGTGTMYTGIVNAASRGQYIRAIPVLKGLTDLLVKCQEHFNDRAKINYCKIHDGYHFGGYAKRNPELIKFMNQLHSETGIPTDFVYTGKLFYALFDLAMKKILEPGARVLIIHSGGLQGNDSLPLGTLNF